MSKHRVNPIYCDSFWAPNVILSASFNPMKIQALVTVGRHFFINLVHKQFRKILVFKK